MEPRTASLPDTDVIVVGAGIVGLATARAIQAIDPHLDVVVLEKEPAPARHQTGHNSGVVHSGIYYPPGSLKAQLVLEGRTLLERRCADWGVPYIECGKVLVATRDSEVDRLATLHRRAQGNGIDAQWLSPAELRRQEPHVRGLAAVSVPSAAITDFGAVARSLAVEITGDGGGVRTSSPVTGIAISDRTVTVSTGASGDTPAVTGRWLVNCAGLHSDRVAALAGCDPAVSIVPFRGDYSTLRPSEVGLVRGLVYPVPDPRWPFLGVHLTPMVDGSVHVGPSAVLALGREAYDGGWRRPDAIDLARDRGLWRLAGALLADRRRGVDPVTLHAAPPPPGTPSGPRPRPRITPTVVVGHPRPGARPGRPASRRLPLRRLAPLRPRPQRPVARGHRFAGDRCGDRRPAPPPHGRRRRLTPAGHRPRSGQTGVGARVMARKSRTEDPEVLRSGAHRHRGT